MFEELKMPVGRPLEFSEKRIDLTNYLISRKFEKQVKKFFTFWDRVVANKAGKNVYLIHNMESFYGEVIDKFEELSEPAKRKLFNKREPFRFLSESTNLKVPTVFKSKENNEDFVEVFLTHKFEKDA